MKGISLAVEFPGPSDPDPVIWFLPQNLLAVFLIGLEIWVAMYVLSRKRRQNQFAAVLILSSGFLGYRLAKWLYFRDSSCECLGSIFEAWGNGYLDLVALLIALSFFGGSLFGLLVMGKPENERLAV